MAASESEITAFLQHRLAVLGLADVAAVQAAQWLQDAGLLADSSSRRGKPLRDLLRAGKIGCAEQRPPTPNGRWFIVSRDSSVTAARTRQADRATAPEPAVVLEPEGAARRRSCTPAEVQRALCALDLQVIKVAARDWPGGLSDLDQPGLYSWWVDAAGAEHLSEGLGHPVAAGRLYAGQTGATKWPSGKAGSGTLAGRIGSNHLNGRIRGSTFRLTLAACLIGPLTLTRIGAKRLDGPSEARLSTWMRDHLQVAVMPFPERDQLGDIEHHVLAELDPPLNLEGMPRTPARLLLSRRRSELS